VELPEELPQKAEPVVEVRGSERQVAHEAANLCLHGDLGGAMSIAVEGERFEEQGDEAFFFAGGSEGWIGGERGRGGFRVGFRAGAPDELVQDNGNGLAEVHGGVFGAGGNAEQKLAMAEIVIG